MIATAVVVLLAGCRPIDVVMTTINDGVLTFAPCEEISGVQHIDVSLDGVEMWHSRGEDGVFGPTAPVTYGVDPVGFTTDVGPGDLLATSDRIQFSLINTAVDQRVWVINPDELVEGKWLDQYGRLHDSACGT